MMIDEYQQRKKPQTMDEDKEIKVRIPLDYHIKLHTVKVVAGTPISDTVRVALESYFAELDAGTKVAVTTS
jgi:DNA-binding protein Fis